MAPGVNALDHFKFNFFYRLIAICILMLIFLWLIGQEVISSPKHITPHAGTHLFAHFYRSSGSCLNGKQSSQAAQP